METVKEAIKRLVKDVKEVTGTDITEYLEDCVELYEINDNVEKSSCEYIIRGLETEADIFIDAYVPSEPDVWCDDAEAEMEGW